MKKKSFRINFLLSFCLIGLLSIFLACGDEGDVTEPPDDENGEPTAGISFATDVKPILDARCALPTCHGGEPPTGGLSLTSYDNLKKGGNSGAAFMPNNSQDSLIVKRISPGGGMPPGGEPLSEKEIETIKKWIDEGGENN